MNLEKFFNLQQNLDNQIMKVNISNGQSLISKELLALQVNIGQLANETNCYKYWNNINYFDSNAVLKHFICCMHFIISLGVTKGYKDVGPRSSTLSNDITEQFNNLFIDINDFIVSSSKDHYATLLEDFLNLGKSLNLAESEIENAFSNKMYGDFFEERQVQ
jgi:dimeric dUTPase (all-alpha-NTP-PPase superfamily)